MFVVLIFGVFTWLRFYTHHGQKLELPDYLGENIEVATKDATDRSFEIIVNDSVHIVGKKGGLVQNQNPRGGALVKEDRKIYVTITKNQADLVDLSTMRFFGEEFDQVRADLKAKSVFTKIIDYKHDRLAENSVMEVWHNGDLVINRSKDPESFIVEKGSTLEFVVSTSEGGTYILEDLSRETLGNAKFKLSPYDAVIEVINGDDTNSAAIIISQTPPPGTRVSYGSTIKVTVEKEE